MSASSAASVARPTLVRWRIVAWVVLAAVVAYILRYNMSVAAPAMMHDLGLTEQQLGYVLGAFAWTYGLLQAPGGMIGQRFGPRLTMAAMLVAWFVTTALMAAVPHALPAALAVTLLVILRAAQGAVQAPLFPISGGGSIFAWLPPRRWAMANGLDTAGTTLGAALAGPGVTWLVLTVGWRASFLISAPLALVLAVVWWYDYRDRPAEHRGVSAAELQIIDEDRASAVTHVPLKWAQLLGDRDLICITLSYFCLNYVFYLFFNWFYYYLSEIRHLSSTLSGYFVGAQWMVGTLTAVIGGVVCDRLSLRLGATRGCRLVAITGLLVSVPLLVAGTLSQDAALCVTLLSLSFGCIQFVDASYWAATTRMAGHDAQSATGMMNTGGNVVGGIGAMLVPTIAGAFGWTAALASGAVFAIVGALLWLGVRAEQTIQSRVPQVLTFAHAT